MRLWRCVLLLALAFDSSFVSVHGAYQIGGLQPSLAQVGVAAAPAPATPANCDAGKYRTEANECRNCPVGQYTASSGASACQECVAGKKATEGSTQCADCEAGKTSKAGSGTCTDCSAGKYSAAASGECTSCEGGKHSAAGSAECTNCAAATYAVPGQSACRACPRGDYSAEEGMSACKKCPSGYVANEGQDACITRNEAAGVPTFVFIGYLGLLMTFSLLATHARVSQRKGKYHSVMVGALSAFIFFEIMVFFYALVVPDSFGKGNIAVLIASVMFVVAKIVFVILDIVEWVKEQKESESETQGLEAPDDTASKKEKSKKEVSKKEVSKTETSKKDKAEDTKEVTKEVTEEDKGEKKNYIKEWFKGQHGLSLDVITVLTLGVSMFRVMFDNQKGLNNMRRADMSIMVIVQFAIQMQVSALVQNVYEGGPNISQPNLIMSISLMMLHAVLFPASLVIHIRSKPVGETLTGPENTNIHFIADYFGLMAVGGAVALMILEKAHDATNESADQLKQYSVKAEHIKREREFIDCTGGDGTSLDRQKYLEGKSMKVKARLYEFLKTEVDDDHRCKIAERMEPINWKLLTFEDDDAEMQCLGALNVDEKVANDELASKLQEMSDPARQCSIITGDVAEDLEQALRSFVAEKKKGMIKMGSSFGMMMLVADAYYGAVYNVIDMANAMAPQEDLVNTVWAVSIITSVSVMLWIIIYFYWSNEESDVDEFELKGPTCRPLRKNRATNREECATGFYYTTSADKCQTNLKLTCKRCPGVTPYAVGSGPGGAQARQLLLKGSMLPKGASLSASKYVSAKKSGDTEMDMDMVDDCKSCSDPIVSKSCNAGTHYSFERCRTLFSDVCIPCKEGTHSNAGQTACTACKAGTFSKSGQDTCTKCEAGTYARRTGQSSCTPCETGTYTQDAGQSACHVCDKTVNAARTACA